MLELVPKPIKPFNIPERFYKRLQKWKEIIKKISSRILFQDNITEEYLSSLLADIKKNKKIKTLDVVKDWPNVEEVLFVLKINSSMRKRKKYLFEDIFIFCINNKAFGLDYFFIDGKKAKARIFSLDRYSSMAKTWKYILYYVVKPRILEIEELIKPSPKIRDWIDF